MEYSGKPENRGSLRRDYERPVSRAGEMQARGSLKLIEVVRMRSIRPLPLAPEYLKGVIEFRGETIPVVDLRIRLGLKPRDYTAEALIAVLETMTASGAVRMGLVSDSISGL